MNSVSPFRAIWKLREGEPTSPSFSILSQLEPGMPHWKKNILQCRNFVTLHRPLIDRVGIESIINSDMWMLGVRRLQQAIDSNQSIYVWGDFDVDGCTSTVSLVSALRKLGADVTYGIADRMGGGHGIDLGYITLNAPQGSLIVTVDNGISGVNEVSELIEQGYDVLITDHHLAEGELPDALIVNPKVSLDESNLEYHVPGVYVASKLACLLAEGTDQYEDIASFCHVMTALGIISDVVPLNDWVRQELIYGLIELQNIQHAGLAALFKMCYVKEGQPLTSKFLAYTVIPKLNAAGRMGNPYKAIDLLLNGVDDSPNQEISLLRAMQLKHINEERKLLEQNIYDQCVEMIDQMDPPPDGIVLYKPNWHPGILGVIASRLVEEYNRPVIIFAKRDKQLVGSGRGVDGFDLYGALQKCEHLLLGYGGHRVAAGMQLKEENLPEFIRIFCEDCKHQLQDFTPVLLVDTEVTIYDLHNVDLQLFLENIQPTGKENDDVTLLVRDLTVINVYEKRQALHVVVKDTNEDVVTLTRFRPSDRFKVEIGDVIDALITTSYTYFSGNTIVEWRMIDVKIHQDNLHQE